MTSQRTLTPQVQGNSPHTLGLNISAIQEQVALFADQLFLYPELKAVYSTGLRQDAAHAMPDVAFRKDLLQGSAEFNFIAALEKFPNARSWARGTQSPGRLP